MTSKQILVVWVSLTITFLIVQLYLVYRSYRRLGKKRRESFERLEREDDK